MTNTTTRRIRRSTPQRVRSVSDRWHTQSTNHVRILCCLRTAFGTKYWSKFLLVTLGTVAFFKFAPSPEGDSWLGRTIAHYKATGEFWTKLNNHHMLQSADVQAGNLIIQDARMPAVHRYRYPQ